MRPTPSKAVSILAACLAALALMPQACGSDDGTKKALGSGGMAGRGGAGGAGGSAGKGGSGGIPSSAGEAGQGGAGVLRCGSALCSPVSAGDFTLAPCCPEGLTNQCGYQVSEAAALLGLVAGCIATNQPGPEDASCADIDGPSLPGAPATFAGCCNQAGVCGVRVDLDEVLGVDFGCVEVTNFVDAGAPQSCGDTGAGGQGGEGGAAGGGGGDAGGGGEGGAPTVCGGSSLGLVAHFPGEGNANDSSGRGHDALFVSGSGGALGFDTGQDGQAFSLLGDGHLETADAADLDVAVGVTLAAWIRSDAGAGEHRDIVGKDGEGYVNGAGTDFERQYLLIVSDLDRLRAHVGTPNGFKVLDGATSISLGTWVHAAMTYDAQTGELILYVNGTPDGSLVVPEGDRCVIDTPQPLRIGGGAPAPYDQLFFTGLIDDVRVYDRALSAAEIAALQ